MIVSSLPRHARRVWTPALLLLSVGLLDGCDEWDFPRDPDRTLQTVLATREMTVAAVDHPPWVILGSDAPPSGAEVALIEAFADELGVEIDWRRLSAFAALEGLEQGELDLAIGGFTQKDVSPHAGAAPTYGYFTEALVVAGLPGAAIPTDVEGRVIFLPADVMAADLVRAEGALPTTEMEEDVGLVAVPHWRIESQGLLPTGVRLRQDKHVMAVPQGENAWIMRLERFLRSQSTPMDDRLRAHHDE
jgi:polar amino acid transport system substrate-binding protein